MRPKSIPEFTKKMNEFFKLNNGHLYLDMDFMLITNRLELDIFKLDDLLHERHGEYENDGKSMNDMILKEYGLTANAFVDAML